MFETNAHSIEAESDPKPNPKPSTPAVEDQAADDDRLLSFALGRDFDLVSIINSDVDQWDALSHYSNYNDLTFSFAQDVEDTIAPRTQDQPKTEFNVLDEATNALIDEVLGVKTKVFNQACDQKYMLDRFMKEAEGVQPGQYHEDELHDYAAHEIQTTDKQDQLNRGHFQLEHDPMISGCQEGGRRDDNDGGDGHGLLADQMWCETPEEGLVEEVVETTETCGEREPQTDLTSKATTIATIASPPEDIISVPSTSTGAQPLNSMINKPAEIKRFIKIEIKYAAYVVVNDQSVDTQPIPVSAKGKTKRGRPRLKLNHEERHLRKMEQNKEAQRRRRMKLKGGQD